MENEMKKTVLISKNLTRLCDRLNEATMFISSWLLFLMFLFSCVVIFFRYALANPISWSSDILMPAFVWTSMLGISIGVRTASHMAVDSLVKLLPQSVQGAIYVATRLLMGSFCVFLVIVGANVTYAARETRWGILQWTTEFFYVAFPISFFLIFLYCLDDILKKCVLSLQSVTRKEA